MKNAQKNDDNINVNNMQTTWLWQLTSYDIYICVVLTIINKRLRVTERIWITVCTDESWNSGAVKLLSNTLGYVTITISCLIRVKM